MAKRAPFDFNQRVSLAKTYLDDGAPLTAASRLESLARDLRKAGEDRLASIGVTSEHGEWMQGQLRFLLTSGLSPATVRQIMAEQDQEAHAAHIEAARERWAKDDLEIDDTPEVSEGSNGCWIAAWVWVPDSAAGITTAQDEDEEADALA